MNTGNLSAIDKLKILKESEPEAQIKQDFYLDPKLFFTKDPEDHIDSNIDLGLFSSPEEVSQKPNDNLSDDIADDIFASYKVNSPDKDLNNSITEDDLFGGQEVAIVASEKLESVIDSKSDKIAELEKSLKATVLEVNKPVIESVGVNNTINGNIIKSYSIEEDLTPAKKVAKATKQIKKVQTELTGVENLEKILITLLVHSVKSARGSKLSK
jgi:hypothetical protein